MKRFKPVMVLMLMTVTGYGLANTGQETFETNCAACHGEDGNAVLPGTPHFSKGERLEKTDEQLINSIENGLNVMPPWNGVLEGERIKELVGYIRALNRA